MKKVFYKIIIILTLIIFFVPYIVHADVNYEGLYSKKGECMYNVLSLGENTVQKNFQIENAIKKYTNYDFNDDDISEKESYKKMFNNWVENVIKVIDKGAPSSKNDFINTSGKQAYNLWNDNKSQTAELQEFCDAAKNGTIAFATNCSTMGDVNYTDDTKGLAEIAETFVKDGGFLSIGTQLKTSVDITREMFDNLLSKKQLAEVEYIENYADKLKNTYGSVGRSEYYAISARLTFNAAKDISLNFGDLGGDYPLKFREEYYTKERIIDYYKKYGYNYSFADEYRNQRYEESVKNLEKQWYSILMPDDEYTQEKMQSYVKDIIMQQAKNITQKSAEEFDQEYGEIHDDTLYHHPQVSKTETDIDTDQTIQNADDFINTKDDNNPNNNINTSELSEFFNPIYNTALIIGIIVAVIVGAILGIKFMTGSVEQKADTKKLLIPYVAGCIAVFGAFGIWKLVVTILAGI